MKIKIEITCDNAAFGDTRESMIDQVHDILNSRSVTNDLYDGCTLIKLRDSNGNLVGSVSIETD